MAEKKKPETKPRTLKTRRLEVASNEFTPASIALLNSLLIFQGRVKFARFCRRGTVREGHLENGHVIHWLSITDVRTFPRSQDLIADATGFLVPTPPRRSIFEVWEPVAQLILDLCEMDSQEDNDEPGLKEEFENNIRITWNRAKRPYANDRQRFVSILQECQTEPRRIDRPPDCCVWAGGDGELAQQYCWIHQSSLLDWLSTQSAKQKYYPWDEARKAFRMLGFTPHQPHYAIDGESIKIRLWRGPISVLIDIGDIPLD